MLLSTDSAAAAGFLTDSAAIALAGAGAPPFEGFPKIARLSREVVATEKLDGTNASILIDDWGQVHVGSRTRWITPEADNYGFARWVAGHRQELIDGLGYGKHFGEWWGAGIQRGYGLKEKRFSLFNVRRWKPASRKPSLDEILRFSDEAAPAPAICDVVPILYRGPLDTNAINAVMTELSAFGSKAAPGFMKPEGIIVFHTAASVLFKKTIERDEAPKGMLH